MRTSALSGPPNSVRHGRRRLPAPAGGAKTAIRTSPEHRLLSDPLSDACGLSDSPSGHQNALRCRPGRPSCAPEGSGPIAAMTTASDRVLDRRTFVVGGVAALAAPLAAQAQQGAKVARIGWLGLDLERGTHLRVAFLEGLRDL